MHVSLFRKKLSRRSGVRLRLITSNDVHGFRPVIVQNASIEALCGINGLFPIEPLQHFRFIAIGLECCRPAAHAASTASRTLSGSPGSQVQASPSRYSSSCPKRLPTNGVPQGLLQDSPARMFPSSSKGVNSCSCIGRGEQVLRQVVNDGEPITADRFAELCIGGPMLTTPDEHDG